MASKAQIANLALHRMGVSQLVANVDTEQSQAAISIAVVWDQERDTVLRSWPWPFATGYAALALVDGTESAPVNRDWQFAYRYPDTALTARRLVTETGRFRGDPPPFALGRDGSGRLIFTNLAQAHLEYTWAVTEPEEFDPLFVSLLAWRLVCAVGPALSRRDRIDEWGLRMFLLEGPWASAVAANEGQTKPDPDPSWIRARS